MYCSNCGKKFEENENYCSNCGKKNPNIMEEKQLYAKKSKSNKKWIILSILLVFIILFTIGILINKNDNRDITIHEIHNGKRTIMIYASPTNLESEARQFTVDLNSLDPTNVDLDKVNVLIYTGGTEKWHNFVSNKENAIYELTSDGFKKVKTYDKLSMGNPNTLSTFINYVYENYESEYYDLMFYDHGGAIGGAIVDDFVKNDILTLNEIKKALNDTPFNKNNKLEMILFRTCLMGTLEVGVILEPYTNYLVASEDSIYMGGVRVGCLDYIENIDENSTPITIAQDFISDYTKYSNKLNSRDVYLSYSIIDLSKINNVFNEYTNFINELDIDKYYQNISKIRNSNYTYGGEEFDMTDLYSLVSKLSNYSTYDSKKVLNAINDAVLYLSTNNKRINNGISVYFPSSSNKTTEAYLKLYQVTKINENYYNFMDKYISLLDNKSSKYLTTASINSKTSISTDNEFKLQLSDKEANEFVKANYIIMKKVDDVYYMPVYTSDDAYLDSNNVLKTNITNRIIRLKDVKDSNGAISEDSYIAVYGFNIGTENGYYKTFGIVNNYSSDLDIADWESEIVDIQIVVENNIPIIKTITKSIYDNNSSTNIAIDTERLNNIEFLSSSYKLIDENGNYTGSTDESNPTIYGYSSTLDNAQLEFVNLEGSGEYYCVFIIKDIYGNTTPSKVIKLTK